MPEPIDFDHVAVAAERLSDLWPRYIGDLGGQWLHGGPSPGFDWAQVVYANEMRLEGLQPARVDEFDFLQRYLDRHGPGPHHLTFKVPDLNAVLAGLARRGIEPARVDRNEPTWQEAFVFPRDAWGIVLQLVEAGEGDEDDDELLQTVPPEDVPAPRAPTARLDRVTLWVNDLEEARSFYEDVLGGHASTGDDHRAVDLAWPGPGRIRLVQPEGAEGDAWLDGRPGGLHHLAFTRPGAPATEVAPETNLGVRLLVNCA